jgi:hypothetical protein
MPGLNTYGSYFVNRLSLQGGVAGTQSGWKLSLVSGSFQAGARRQGKSHALVCCEY